jgi:hypothetical protein
MWIYSIHVYILICFGQQKTFLVPEKGIFFGIERVVSFVIWARRRGDPPVISELMVHLWKTLLLQVDCMPPQSHCGDLVASSLGTMADPRKNNQRPGRSQKDTIWLWQCNCSWFVCLDCIFFDHQEIGTQVNHILFLKMCGNSTKTSKPPGNEISLERIPMLVPAI